MGISAAMHGRQEAYHDALNIAQHGDGDVTAWLERFLETYVEACRTSSVLIVRPPGPGGRSTRYDLALPGREWQPAAMRE